MLIWKTANEKVSEVTQSNLLFQWTCNQTNFLDNNDFFPLSTKKVFRLVHSAFFSSLDSIQKLAKLTLAKYLVQEETLSIGVCWVKRIHATHRLLQSLCPPSFHISSRLSFLTHTLDTGCIRKGLTQRQCLSFSLAH